MPVETLERVFRRERGQILAVLIRLAGDVEVAEDALQDAFAEALKRWPDAGVPPRPGAWITTVARRRAIDGVRRASTHRRKKDALERLMAAEGETFTRPISLPDEDGGPRDDQLRLLYTCSHPSLSRESQVALTLRLVAGLTVPEIARAFLAAESSMAQRITRAKKKIRSAGIPFRVPPATELEGRTDAVLAVVYLIFNEGYFSTSEPGLMREDLCGEAIRLGRLLDQLLPGQPEVEGLLALMLLHSSRSRARLSREGELITLGEQNRALWDPRMIREGRELVDRALRRGRVGSYQLQAAIAAVHAEATSAERTDWRQIQVLYGVLMRVHPSPVIALNHAVAVGMARGPAAGLELIGQLDAEGELAGYQPLHVARAELLDRSGDAAGAAESFRRAIELCHNPVERSHLERRLAEVETGSFRMADSAARADPHPAPTEPLREVR